MIFINGLQQPSSPAFNGVVKSRCVLNFGSGEGPEEYWGLPMPIPLFPGFNFGID
jgi:hypothetical protein